MRDWKVDSAMYRGGGCYADAMRLLADARIDPPKRFLRDQYTLATAREVLRLPCDLPVPDGPDSCRMKNFNNEATSGPLLFSFGCKLKAGLSAVLSNFMWNCFNDFANNVVTENSLPFFCGRVGFRSKLVSFENAVEKLSNGKPIGRCVVMLDALEQAASSPLYNALTQAVLQQGFDRLSGFRNTVIRASSDWINFWHEIRTARVIVELDWKKFDRERPAEDIQFCIDVFLSCFRPRNLREERLLLAYGICMRRALVERVFVTDKGGVFSIDGMVPSGSLWTGFLDTALNILYMSDVLLDLGFTSGHALPKCCGDDNLTLFFIDPGDHMLQGLRDRLNSYYRAGIDPEDFIITRPPFYVTTEQAVFPPGTDLSQGTSHLLDKAVWTPFEGEVQIDEAQGRSHRWRYNFFGKPKFLSCYWLPSGLPIRPAKDNLEKLLFPEGIQKSLDDYVASLLAMVVDNPFNHHNVNHLKHRFIIAQQILRVSVLGIKTEDILKFSRIRPDGDEPVPFPMVCEWRRQSRYVDLNDYALTRHIAQEFDRFVTGVTTLYKRASTGGLDSYHFMDLIRGETSVGDGQWGNDVDAWLRFVRDNPLTKYLKRAKRFQRREPKEKDTVGEMQKANSALEAYHQKLRRESFGSTEEFALWLSSILRQNSTLA